MTRYLNSRDNREDDSRAPSACCDRLAPGEARMTLQSRPVAKRYQRQRGLVIGDGKSATPPFRAALGCARRDDERVCGLRERGVGEM